MAEFHRAVEQFSASSRGEEETTYNNWRTRVVAGIAAVGVSAAAFLHIAPANADEIVIVPGMGDPTGQGYENQLRATGQIGPNDTVHKVPYSASIWPLGPVPMAESVNESVVNGRGVLAEAQRQASPGERIQIRGYSEGGPGAARLAHEFYGPSVQPGTVIFDGAPVSSTGIFENQDPLVRTFMPLATNMLQIPTGDRGPAGSIVRHSQQDVWAAGGRSDLGQLIPQAMDTFMGPAHAVQNPNAPHNVWVGPDGIIHHEFPGMGTGGVPPMGVTMGGPGVVAPAPAPAPEARPAPNSPNFTAVSREWKRNHPERYPEFAAQEEKRAERQDSQDNSRTVTTRSSRGGTNKQTTSYSKKFEPPVKASQSNRLNRK